MIAEPRGQAYFLLGVLWALLVAAFVFGLPELLAVGAVVIVTILVAASWHRRPSQDTPPELQCRSDAGPHRSHARPASIHDRLCT